MASESAGYPLSSLRRQGVDTAKISAEFAKGVLEVTMPKTVEARKKQPRKIAVKGG